MRRVTCATVAALIVALGAPASAAPSAPAGWKRWSAAPADCTIWVPERATELDELTWTRCPFQAEGCEALGAPWAARTGWGFGGRLSAASDCTHSYLAVTRAIAADQWETIVLEDPGPHPTVVAAVRQQLPGAGCVVGSVALRRDGDAVTATLPILREAAEAAPVVLLGTPRTLIDRPRIEAFGAPGAAVLAREVAWRSGDLLAVWEHEGRFAVRELATGATRRPTPATAFRFLLEPTPVAGAVLYAAWTGDRGSVWADRGGASRAVLADPAYSYDRFASDGHDAVWTRGRGFVALNTFHRAELWAGQIAGGTVVMPRRVAALDDEAALPLVSLGDGHAALWRSGDDVRIVRLSDGQVRRLPAVAMLSWDGGSGGLEIAGGAVWARASLRGAPGNDLRIVVRFALDALPVVGGAG